MSGNGPKTYLSPEYNVPLTPRPGLSHNNSSSTLPATPYTPYPPPPQEQAELKAPIETPLKPFLGLPSRLFLTTLSPALLPLILTIAHLIQNRSSTASLADTLRSSLLSACSGLAEGAAGLLTMPRYLAMQTNEQAVAATQASILAVGAALEDCVTIIQVVVIFIVDTYRSMLLCTIELAVRGTLEVFIAGVKTISDGITSSLNTIRTSIQSDISSANSLIQSAVSKVNSLTSKINISIEIPEFSVPALSSLENVTIPTGFQDSLVKLNSSIPTLSELKEKMNDLIEIPFEKLKVEINSTRLEMAASFNSSILPVPSLSQLSASKSSELNSELCGDLDTSLIDDTAKALHKLSNVAIGLMFLLLFLVWAAMCFWEWRKWRALRDTVELVEDEWRNTGRQDAWRVVAIVEHPIMERYGTPVLARISPNPRTRANLRWYLAYLAHPTCLALLFIALLGFLSIQFQLVALDAIKSHAKENANATVAASTSNLSTKLNQLATNSSQDYAAQYNAAIDQYEKRINDELFGSWLNTTAVTLNSTLVEFYDGVEDVLNKTFGNTVLYQPFSTFMYCILGSKITNLEKGLTWVSNHAHVDLPRVPTDILVLSQSSMNEIAEPISAAAVGSGSSDDDGFVGSLISHFESALKVERTFYGILLGVWLAFALFGIIVVIWHSGGKDRYDGWRGKSRPDDDGGEQSVMLRWLPWIKDEHPIYDQHIETPSTNANVPRIIEPKETDSFFDYRPQDQQNGTLRSTFSALAAPGQAFLKLSLSGQKSDDGHVNLTDGNTSEEYNSYADPPPRQGQGHYARNIEKEDDGDEGRETPPPFWVNKFYRAVDSAKAFFPTRGQRHGAALARNASVRTEQSFGASQAVTPRGWVPEEEQDERKGGWAMVDPQQVGRELDDPVMDVGSRYPTLSYPRRLSRAPTLHEGGDHLPRTSHTRTPSNLRDIFADPPPPPPPKADSKHDSIDYLYDTDPEPESEDDDNPFSTGYGYARQRLPLDQSHYHTREEIVSPASSSASYLPEARVESVEKVQTGTAALAAILANMQERRASDRRNGAAY